MFVGALVFPTNIGFIRLSMVSTQLVRRCCSVIATSIADVALTLCNAYNPTLDFVLFSTWDQRYLNIDTQRWSNVDLTLKCGLGWFISQNLVPNLSLIIWLIMKLKGLQEFCWHHQYLSYITKASKEEQI